MKIKVNISNRHIHLTKEDFMFLFGNDNLSKRNDLVQTGEYASNLVVSLKGPKGVINNVRIVGPFRSYTQVEVSKTDCYTLGIDAPVRDSGDLSDASYITIINKDKILKRKCAIIAKRHIHISLLEQEKYNLNSCYVKITGEKSGILDDVTIKEGVNSKLELHLDYDDANAFLLKNGDVVEVLKH